MSTAEQKPKRRSGRRSLLERLMTEEPERYQQLLQYIRLGCYDHVAAQSLGINPTTWYAWMRRGVEKRSKLYVRFYQDVRQAQAHARMMAELSVKRDDPKFWLRCGPGKTRLQEGVPLDGWTDEPSVVRIEGNPDKPLRVEQEADVSISLSAALEVFVQAGLLSPDNLSEMLRQAEAQTGTVISQEDAARLTQDGSIPPEIAAALLDDEPDPEDLEEV